MEAKAITKNVRISPEKARAVVDAIRGKDVDEALKILRFSKKKASEFVQDTLESAMANAQHNHDMDVERLKVQEAVANQGQNLKRMKPRALGRADVVTKKRSHIKIILVEEE